jgi:hypothetical protein
MRRAVLVALGVLAAGLVGLVLAAVLHRTPRAFTLGVPSSAPVAAVSGGQTVCQQPIDVPAGAAFDRVTAIVGTYHKPGSPLELTVRDLRNRVVASSRIPGGYPDIARAPVHFFRLGRTVSTPRIAVCLRNTGRRRVAFYGTIDLAARSSSAYLDGRPLHVDLNLQFQRASRSMASLVPRMLDRAALFRFPWMGAWTYVVLAVLLLVGAPWLLVRALASATGEARTTRRRRS